MRVGVVEHLPHNDGKHLPDWPKWIRGHLGIEVTEHVADMLMNIITAKREMYDGTLYSIESYHTIRDG